LRIVNMESEEKTQLFSSRLIGIRNGLGLTQTELADKVGVSLRSVQHWESGEFVPRGQQLRNLAANIGVTVSYLLGDEPPPEQVQEAMESFGAGPEQELRRKCHGHLERVLDECQGNRDQLAWTYVEQAGWQPGLSAAQFNFCSRSGSISCRCGTGSGVGEERITAFIRSWRDHRW
jgi:transcriptional regulator with XRE-family HTH domain